MAQFDVFENPNDDTNQATPYLLDVQADNFHQFEDTRSCPLMIASAMGRPAKHLNPHLEINGLSLYMSTAELAGISVRFLGKKVGSLKAKRDEILGAVDFLLTGF